ncbi:hypothetical protein B0E55_06398 [Rhodococcus sp. 66b]|nr:hypothetical protein B0E55_06398 [Rhodococcus sp. 66b]
MELVGQVLPGRHLRLDVFDEGRIDQHASNFVLVLVRGELEQAAGDRFTEIGPLGCGTFSSPDCLNLINVALGDLDGLELDELCRTQFDQSQGFTGEGGSGEHVSRCEDGFADGLGRRGDGRERCSVGNCCTAPTECRDVRVHGNAVDADRFFDGLGRQTKSTALVGSTDQQEVGGCGVTEQLLCRGECVERAQGARHLVETGEE